MEQEDKDKKISSLRGRGIMYAQQLKYSPYKDIDSLYNGIEKLDPKRFAVIIHDKDIDKHGNLEEKHFQAMIEFKNPRYLTAIAKALGDKPEFFEIWDSQTISNGFAYLTHRTTKAKTKYQYDPLEVKANFDYPAELKRITSQVEKAKHPSKVEDLLDGLYDGTLCRKDVENHMTGSQYGKNCKKIEDIVAKRLRQEAEEFCKNRIKSGKPLEVIWIYGKSGTGKTSLAKKIAEQKECPYYLSGSSRDIFQAYKGEHTVILDEFRAGMIMYADLLKILDPYGEMVMAPSRYHDKYLACDLIIFTSPYSPIEYYYEEVKGVSSIETLEQLQRRISLTLYLDESYIYLAEYFRLAEDYILSNYHKKQNIFSRTARKNDLNFNADKMFQKLFDIGGR